MQFYNDRSLDMEVILEIISILLASAEPHETNSNRWAGSQTLSSVHPGWGLTILGGCLVHDEKLYCGKVSTWCPVWR